LLAIPFENKNGLQAFFGFPMGELTNDSKKKLQSAATKFTRKFHPDKASEILGVEQANELFKRINIHLRGLVFPPDSTKGVLVGTGKKRCIKCGKLRGGSKWDFIKSLGDQILSIREQNKEKTSKQQYTAPYPFHVGKRPEIKPVSLISEPNVDVELNKLIREGSILKGEKEYFKRKLEQYLQLSLAQRNKFSVKEPTYSKMTPQQFFKGIISREDGEDKLLQFDQPENMTDEEYERLLTLFDKYVKQLPTKAQLKKKSKSVEQEMKEQNAALAALQGTQRKF